MARAIDPREPFDYILPEDRALPEDAPDRTVWRLRALTPAEDARIQDRVAFGTNVGTDEQEVGYRSGSVSLETLRLGLVGWDKLLDGSGEPVKFLGRRVGTTGGVRIEATDEDIARVNPKHRVLLTNAISSANTITEDEAGKS